MASDNIKRWATNEMRGKKVFNIDDIVDKAVTELNIDQNYEDLKRYYLKSNLETIANQEECFSIGKGNFARLSVASMEDLKQMDANFDNNIKGLEKTRMKILAQEQHIRGQQEFVFDGSILSEIKTSVSLLEQVEEALQKAE